MLEVVGGARSIAAAIGRLRRRLAGLPVRNVSISWHGGGSLRGDIVWLRDERFWWRHDAERRAGRYSLMFGFAPQAPSHGESATCEINLPASGTDRRLAGALVRDATGALYLAHSGKIGGGRSGRRRAAFRVFLAGGNWQAARWPDGRASELLLVGPLDGPRLACQIGRFVAAVHLYKRQQEGDATAPMPGESASWTDDAAELAALCDRGLVLDALGEELARRGLSGDGGAGAPLFAMRGRARRLIEVETGSSPAALERRLGRLLLRGVAAHETPRAILVVPEVPATAALAGLAVHGVNLVRYRWRGARPVFVGLDAALG